MKKSLRKLANDFISLKFGDVRFLHILKQRFLHIFGRATTLDSFLEAYKANELKDFPLRKETVLLCQRKILKGELRSKRELNELRQK